MNDASNIPENEQPESIPTASGAAQTPDENTVQAAEETTAQTPEETVAQTPEETTAQPNTCPQCGAALKPGASFCANCGAPVDNSDDVTYHIVRPEAERSYEDANFQPSDDAANTPPRYYTPDADAWAEKPKRKRRARRPRTARTPEQKRLITRIACPVPRVCTAGRARRRRSRGAHQPLRQERGKLRLRFERHTRDAASQSRHQLRLVDL